MLNLSSLNDKQLEAVTYESGNLLVLAGPGSGKTYTIVQRIYYLIEVLKVKPEKILVITFTKDSAIEMQNRFISGSDLFYPVVFGTFHSVFYHILRSVNSNFGSILSLSRKKNIINSIIQRVIKSHKYDLFNEINNSELDLLTDSMINAISIYKNTLNLNEALSRIDDKYSVIFQDILNEYEIQRRADKFIDFDDMVYDCLNLLEINKRAYADWSGRFEYILIDEFQDINPVQYKVVKLLMNKHTKLFAVGDDDQSIYSFRGSEPECMKLVIKECNCSIINLQYNYRNPEQIRCLSDVIIKENTSRINKRSISKKVSDENNHVFIYGFENKEKHYEAIADAVSEAVGETVILFRSNIEMQRMAILLNKRGIKFICKEKKQNIYDHFIVKDIMAYLCWANELNNNETVCTVSNGSTNFAARIINKPMRYINRESLIGDNSVIENMVYYYENISDKIFSKKIIENINILKKDLSFIKERSIYLAVVYIFNRIGYKNYVLNSVKNDSAKQEEYNRVMDWFLDDCKGYKTLDEYMDFQNSYSENENSSVNAEGDIPDVQLSLMTVHASKGLEFRNVFIAECNEGNFPHGKMLKEKIVEEERRLFYVAVTRSCENLYLFYIDGSKDKKAIPSRFLNSLLGKSNI